MGFVASSSKVPLLNSSESVLMVMAGIKNINIHGAVAKKLSNVAYKESNIFPGKTQRFNPSTKKNTIILMYPISELKKPYTSFLNILHISVALNYEIYLLMIGQFPSSRLRNCFFRKQTMPVFSLILFHPHLLLCINCH